MYDRHQRDGGRRITWSTYSKIGNKTANINVKNFHRSLTIVIIIIIIITTVNKADVM